MGGMRRKPGIDLNREGLHRLWVGGGPGVGRRCQEKAPAGGRGLGPLEATGGDALRCCARNLSTKKRKFHITSGHQLLAALTEFGFSCRN